MRFRYTRWHSSLHPAPVQQAQHLRLLMDTTHVEKKKLQYITNWFWLIDKLYWRTRICTVLKHGLYKELNWNIWVEDCPYSLVNPVNFGKELYPLYELRNIQGLYLNENNMFGRESWKWNYVSSSRMSWAYNTGMSAHLNSSSLLLSLPHPSSVLPYVIIQPWW